MLPKGLARKGQMAQHTTPAKDLQQAIEVIETTADYYHSMLDHDTEYWWHNYWAALDLLERIQGLPENSLMLEHDKTCDCRE
jgi:hypothetical protein